MHVTDRQTELLLPRPPKHRCLCGKNLGTCINYRSNANYSTSLSYVLEHTESIPVSCHKAATQAVVQWSRKQFLREQLWIEWKFCKDWYGWNLNRWGQVRNGVISVPMQASYTHTYFKTVKLQIQYHINYDHWGASTKCPHYFKWLNVCLSGSHVIFYAHKQTTWKSH